MHLYFTHRHELSADRKLRIPAFHRREARHWARNISAFRDAILIYIQIRTIDVSFTAIDERMTYAPPRTLLCPDRLVYERAHQKHAIKRIYIARNYGL